MSESTGTVALPLADAERPYADSWRANPFVWWALASLASSTGTFLSLMGIRRVLAHSVEPTLESLTGLLWIGGVAAPVIVGLKGVLLAGIIWALLELQFVDVDYRRCLAAVWTGELAIAAGGIWQALVGLFRGATSATELVVPVGLDVFWEPTSAAATVLSRSINVFLLAWGVIVFLRLSTPSSGSSPRATALAVAAAGFVVSVLPLMTLVL